MKKRSRRGSWAPVKGGSMVPTWLLTTSRPPLRGTFSAPVTSIFPSRIAAQSRRITAVIHR